MALPPDLTFAPHHDEGVSVLSDMCTLSESGHTVYNRREGKTNPSAGIASGRDIGGWVTVQ